MSTLGRKLRQRRDAHAFERALRTASPAMQQELTAAASHVDAHRVGGLRIN